MHARKINSEILFLSNGIDEITCRYCQETTNEKNEVHDSKHERQQVNQFVHFKAQLQAALKNRLFARSLRYARAKRRFFKVSCCYYPVFFGKR